MTKTTTRELVDVGTRTAEKVDRDALLQEVVEGDFRLNSPRYAFERANEYVPTKVRAANVGG